MKKTLFVLILLTVSIFFSFPDAWALTDKTDHNMIVNLNSNRNDELRDTQNFNVTVTTDSITGAAIFADGINTGEVTPHTFVLPRNSDVTYTVQKDGYICALAVGSDSNVIVNLTSNKNIVFNCTQIFYQVTINASNVSSASILANGTSTGEVTPHTFVVAALTTVTYTIQKEKYTWVLASSSDSNIIVNLDSDRDIVFEGIPSFYVTITSGFNPAAMIDSNGVYTGYLSYHRFLVPRGKNVTYTLRKQNVAWALADTSDSNVIVNLDSDRNIVFEGTFEAGSGGYLIGWGYNEKNEIPPGNDFIAISGYLALRANGKIVDLGYIPSYGDWDFSEGMWYPPADSDFIAVVAAIMTQNRLALKKDGSLVGWGYNNYIQNVPTGNDFVAIANDGCSLALKIDGSIVAWGISMYDLHEVPHGNDFVAISICRGLQSYGTNLALKRDGSLVAWPVLQHTSDEYGLLNVPAGNDFVAITGGDDCFIAIRSDGSLVAWGDTSYGNCDVPTGNGYIAIYSTMGEHIALKSDGSLVRRGWFNPLPYTPPYGNSYFAIGASIAISSVPVPYSVTVSTGVLDPYALGAPIAIILPDYPTEDNWYTYNLGYCTSILINDMITSAVPRYTFIIPPHTSLTFTVKKPDYEFWSVGDDNIIFNLESDRMIVFNGRFHYQDSRFEIYGDTGCYINLYSGGWVDYIFNFPPPPYTPPNALVFEIFGRSDSGRSSLKIISHEGSKYILIYYNGAWHQGNPYPGTRVTFTDVPIGTMKGGGIPVIMSDTDPTLPVELSSFTAVQTSECFVNLQWTTESETQVLGFNLYRSETSDLINSIRINNSVVAATNTSEQHSYSLTDEQVEIGKTYYYWLENVDMDGTSTMYGPHSVTITENQTPILPVVSLLNNAYPNPFHFGSNAKIKVAIKGGETGTITIFNIRGQCVKTFQVEEGFHTLEWDGNGCASGVYFYRLVTPSITSTKKLLIVK